MTSVSPVGTTPSTGLIGGVGKLIALPFQVFGGAVYGTTQASINSAPTGMFASASGAEGVSIFQKIANWFDNFVGKGIVDINKSGIAGDVARIGEKGSIGTIFTKLFSPAEATGSAAAGVGGRGFALIAGKAAAGVGFTIFGFKTMVSSFWKLSQDMKGYSALDYHRNPLLHGAEAISGLGMLVGGIVSIPGVAAGLGIASGFGLPVAIAGLVGYGITRAISNANYGLNMFTHPKDYLPWPLYLPFQRPATDMQNMRMSWQK